MSVRTAQKGQVVVQVAVLMVVLLAFVALAIDVGHIYAERRRMQNAADAGALAGAREICFGDPGRAVPVAEEYAITRNGAQKADVTIEDYIVTVTARETVGTYLAGIVGLRIVDVGAVAAAACGSAESACGLWPIAFWRVLWDNQLVEHCDKPFYVWNDSKEPDCSVYDCDLDNDGRDDLVIGGDRGWLDFSDVVTEEYPDSCVQPGCGLRELTCHILDDEADKIAIPSCIAGDSGVKAGIKDEVDARAGDIVRIPLYESVDKCTPGHSCPGGNAYWVTAFACVRVKGWHHHLELQNPDDPSQTISGKAIEVTVACDKICATSCGSTGGAPPVPGGLNAVSLIR